MQSIINRKRLGVYAIGLVLSILALPVWAAEDPMPTNTVQMVTYFPVPFARYNNLYPTGNVDIGSMTEKFELNVGTLGFKAKQLTLKKGALQIGENLTTQSVTLGKTTSIPAETADPSITFHDLYLNKVTKTVGTGSQNISITLNVINADLEADSLDKLQILGNKQLPSCDGTVRWKKLDSTIKKCYLVCCKDEQCNGLSECK